MSGFDPNVILKSVLASHELASSMSSSISKSFTESIQSTLDGGAAPGANEVFSGVHNVGQQMLDSMNESKAAIDAYVQKIQDIQRGNSSNAPSVRSDDQFNSGDEKGGIADEFFGNIGDNCRKSNR